MVVTTRGLHALLRCGLLLVCGVLQGPGAFAGDPPPNILLIVTDDQRWDELSVVQKERGDEARFPFLETPHLDRLAAEGVRFRNAFVTTSLCSPSRAAILTGQYNHSNGIVDNETPFPDLPGWATMLRDNGYTTAYFGKWHHGTQWERPGFGYTATYKGQGEYRDTNFRVNGEFLDGQGWFVDALTTKLAVDFLRTHRRERFAMMVGYKAPHRPYTPMEEDAVVYEGKRVKPSPNWHNPVPWLDKKLPVLPLARHYLRPNPDFITRMRTIRGLDRNIGGLLEALDELGLSGDTLVIFTSDNGFQLRDHAAGDKRSAYEESIRVPMIVRRAGNIAPDTSREMVLNIDIAPTILEAAGLAVPDSMQGRSMLPLLEKRPVEWRNEFLYEYWQEYEFWRPSWMPKTPTLVALRTDRYKLVTYRDYPRWTELYDLERDPVELRNIAAYPSARELRDRLCLRLEALKRDSGYVPRVAISSWLIGITEAIPSYEAHRAWPSREWRVPLRRAAC